MKRLGLFSLSFAVFLGLTGCVPMAVSDLPISPTVGATAVPTEIPTLIPITSTPTAAPPNPKNTPASRPARPSPTPTATPFDFPEIWANSITNTDYGAVWSVPVDWQEITVAAPSPDSVFWQAWANDLDAASVELPPRQMRLTIYVENDDSDAPIGVEQRTLWGVVVWTQEITGADNDDFDLRLSLATVREPYQYHYQLDCTQFEQATAAEQATFTAFCRYQWDFLFRFWGLCAVPMEQEANSAEGQQVSDDWYHYFYEVPIDWLKLQGPTPDRITFFSDPLVYNQPNECALPNGLIKVDFSVDPPGNFGTGEPDGAPDTTDYAETTVAGHPAWIQVIQGGELMGPADLGMKVYIRGDDFWYHFWLLCIPPTDADVATQDAFKAQCEVTTSQILASFEIR
ncbi:MAG: hypothetical protein H6657_11445 [Ardenticatenaceae bacterium]|nr:hypothetical protein [Ardenticatenaceae bacterium]